MLPITEEWMEKAEGDWVSLNREITAQNRPNYDLVCFLCQQCAEKYLKARLQEAAIEFPKTHDLVLLLGLVVPIEPLWTALDQSMRILKNYAVRYRYPGDTASQQDAQEAKNNCEAVRDTIRGGFALPL